AQAGSGVGAMAETEGEGEHHYLHVDFVDKGGFPITGVVYTLKKSGKEVVVGMVSGRVRRDGIEPGSYDIELRAITKAEWSTKEAAVGDTVQLSAECAGIDDGKPATLTVYVRDYNSPDRIIKTIPTDVSGGRIEGEWKLDVVEDLLPAKESGGRASYSSPTFYFIASSEGCSGRSGLLRYKDWVELKLKDEEGNPIGNRPFRARLPDGQIREGKLDQNGCAKIENVPPGKVKVTFNVREPEQL
ncbi:MAG: hypothetical protein AB1744_05720, partial [Candidatus Zixiibacteriota bacterium]